MNGMQNNQMGGTWHLTCGVNDRQKVIQVLASTLKEIQSNNFDEQKSAAMALEFEKYTFMKAQSREEYFRMIKQKVTQLRSGMRSNSQGASNMGPSNDMGGQNMANPNMNANYMPRQQNVQIMRNSIISQQAKNPQQQQHQAPQQQQRPVSQQQQLLQPQQQLLLQPQQLQLQQSLQPTQQQIQQISAMIRTVPIPQALLAKIPNLPPNVNTWTQIYDCFQKKVIPTSAMPLIKEIHNAHFQLALRQHQQQKLAQFQRMNGNTQNNDASLRMNQNSQFNIGANSSSGNMNSNVNNMGNVNNMNNMGNMSNMNNMNNMNNIGNMNNVGNMSNMNNMNSMGNMNNVNGMNNMNNMNNVSNMNNVNNMNRQLQGNNMNLSQQLMQQQQNSTFRGNNKPQNMQQLQPQMPLAMGPQLLQQNPANVMKSQAQQHQTQPQLQISNASIGMGQNQQQQAANAKGPAPNIQITSQDLAKYSGDAMALLQRLQQNGSIQPNLDQSQKLNFVRKYIYHQKLNLWKSQKGQNPQSQGGVLQLGGFQSMQQPGQQPQQPPAPQHAQPQSQLSQQQQQQQSMQSMQQNMSNQTLPHLLPMMGQIPQPNATPLVNQAGMNQQLFSPMLGQKGLSGQQPGTNVNTNQMRQNSVASIMPPLTDEMKLKLRALFEEVARNNVQLKDVTMLLSEKEKFQVKDIMTRITQQYANVDSILSYFYVLTRNLEGTKRLIQMKRMTKSIMENLQRGIYLAGPDLIEKLRSQYQKYFDYVKEQITLRRQQQGGQQQPLQQPAQGRNVPPGFPGNQQFAAQNVSQSTQQQNFPISNNGPQMGMQPGLPPQQQQQQQFTRNATNAQQEWQKPGANVGPQRMGGAMASSPIAPTAASPPPSQLSSKQKTPVNKRPSVAAAAGRRKSTKSGSTPSASAPTPATLANAIKTPNSISTPHLPQSQSNKSTPAGNSPYLDNKNPAVVDVPLLGDVFGVSSADSKLMKRRELSTSDPEKFFFAALANLLDVQDPENGQASGKSITNGNAKSPLSPNVSGEWSSDVKPFAIASAFRQVEFIKELTSSDILNECREMVEQEALVKKETSVKREREEESELALLFGEKKLKTEESDFEKYLHEPVEFDEWKGWINSLQDTKT